MGWYENSRRFVGRWFGPDRHDPLVGRTYSERLLVRTIVLSGLAAVISIVGLFLLGDVEWREVVAGALLAWGVSGIVWAIETWRLRTEKVRGSLRQAAEMDLLHGRLNQIAARVGAPRLDLDADLGHAVTFRQNRLAHFSGLDDFHDPHAESVFWTEEAMGWPDKDSNR
jgi:hypothetical protein